MYALKNADFVLCMGVIDNYETDLSSTAIYDKDAVIVNIDTEFQENIFRDAKQHLFFRANVFSALAQINSETDGADICCNEWIEKLSEEHILFDKKVEETINGSELHPLNIIKNIDCIKKEKDSIVVLDGSNAMFWGTYGFKFDKTGSFINGPDGDLGPMGCGLALAIGAKAAAREKKVILYTGDGSFGFNICELDTAHRYGLPITIVVHNDQTWGLCKSTQEILYGTTAGTDLDIVRYDNIVKAFGGNGIFVETDADGIYDKIEEAVNKDELFCFNIIFSEEIFSPGTVAFNSFLEKMK